MCCNRELMLGLVGFEAHYAIYPPGAAYARHRDRFRDDDTRVLSCVLYLNDGVARGGRRRAAPLPPDGATLDVAPQGGTFVAFLSDTFDHEVLPASRERLALTGWFRRRALQALPPARRARIFAGKCKAFRARAAPPHHRHPQAGARHVAGGADSHPPRRLVSGFGDRRAGRSWRQRPRVRLQGRARRATGPR